MPKKNPINPDPLIRKIKADIKPERSKMSTLNMNNVIFWFFKKAIPPNKQNPAVIKFRIPKYSPPEIVGSINPPPEIDIKLNI